MPKLLGDICLTDTEYSAALLLKLRWHIEKSTEFWGQKQQKKGS